MARFHLDNRMAGTQQAISTSFKTMATAVGSTAVAGNTILVPKRGRVVALQVGPDGQPNATDCSIIYNVQRQTAAGTITTVAANPIFQGSSLADVPAATLAAANATAEGTYTLPIWSRALNQRASMQWVAQDVDAMLYWPGVSSAGVTLLALSSVYTNNVLGGIDFEEL